MHSDFKSLTDILQKDKAFSNIRKVVKQNDVVENFSKIFPEFKKVVQANKVEKRILFLVADNSVVRNELFINRSKMIEKINKYFDEEIILDIKFSSFRKQPGGLK